MRNLLRDVLAWFLGLQTRAQDQVKKSVELNLTLAGIAAQAETLAEAEALAASLEKTQPELAAQVRATVARFKEGLLPGTTASTAIAPASAPEAVRSLSEAPNPADPPKRGPGRPKKQRELPPPADGPNPSAGDPKVSL